MKSSNDAKDIRGEKTRKPIVILFAALCIASIIIYAWQYILIEPSYLYCFLSPALVILGIIIVVIWSAIVERRMSRDTLKVLFLCVVVGCLGFILPNMAYKLLLPSNLVSSEYSISTKFSVGNQESLSIRIENNTEIPIKVSNLVITLPKNFFDGFILDYSKLADNSLQKLPVSVPRFLQTTVKVSLSEVFHLAAHETINIEVPIVANTSGDYSGQYSFDAFLDFEDGRFGRLHHSDALNIIIAP